MHADLCDVALLRWKQDGATPVVARKSPSLRAPSQVVRRLNADFHRAPGHFVVRLPHGLDLALAAPMLCGGLTVFRLCASKVLEERRRRTSASSVLFTHPFSPIYSSLPILTFSQCIEGKAMSHSDPVEDLIVGRPAPLELSLQPETLLLSLSKRPRK